MSNPDGIYEPAIEQLESTLRKLAAEFDLTSSEAPSAAPRARAIGVTANPARERQKIASLRERLEQAAFDGRRDHIYETMLEIARVVADADGGAIARRGGGYPPPSPISPVPVPVPVSAVSSAATIFLVANTIMATATITSITWYLLQTAATQRNGPATAAPVPDLRESGWPPADRRGAGTGLRLRGGE